jgi:hypothetical protein
MALVYLRTYNNDCCLFLSGRSHDKSFFLFRIGDIASDGLKTFCETGQSDGLEAQSQGEGGVFDEFNGPAISSGQGSSRTEFFVDGNHTQVSIAATLEVRFCSPDSGKWCVSCSVPVQLVKSLGRATAYGATRWLLTVEAGFGSSVVHVGLVVNKVD